MMLKPRLSPISVILALLLLSCKQPERVVVTEDPTASSPKTEKKDTSLRASDFMQLNIGETDRISSLNPLFADNASTMRALQLVFEGLVRYNGDGVVVPAIAKKWTVSADSLTYRFTLHNNIYYHDSSVFPNGVGRKLTARDVTYVFERMARIDVPDYAARLFMDIRGFEAFFKEQHNVWNPADRRLSGVRGIATPDDSTVTFTLARKDRWFLEKLASPYAVIYPREAVNEQNPAAFRPVGTGPFTFSQKQGSNHFIFSAYQNYHRQGEPVINRVDVTVIADGQALAEAVQKGDLHLVPQLGPASMSRLVNADGKPAPAFAGSFSLAYPAAKTFYALNHNPESLLRREAALAATAYAEPEAFFPEIPGTIIEFGGSREAGPSTGFAGADTLNITFTTDPFLRAFLQALKDTLSQRGIVLNMADIRTPVRSTGLYTDTHIPLHPADVWAGAPNTLIRFSARQTAVYLSSIENLTFNNYLWWMDLRPVTIPEIDNLGR